MDEMRPRVGHMMSASTKQAGHRHNTLPKWTKFKQNAGRVLYDRRSGRPRVIADVKVFHTSHNRV